MKVLANKYFIIALCLAIFLTVVPTTWLAMGRADLVQTSINTIAAPFRFVGHSVAQGLKGFGSYFSSVDKMQKELETLKKENQALKEQLIKDQILQKQNENLQQYIHLQNPLTNREWIESTVVSVRDNLWIVNKGTESGVSLNMPVIDAQGAVGKITSVGLGWSYIELVTSPSFKVSVKDVESGSTGYLSGSVKLGQNGQSMIFDFAEDAVIHEGDLIISSGYGSVWPEGFLFGTVESVKIDEATRSPIAVVRMAANLQHPGHVLIMMGEHE